MATCLRCGSTRVEYKREDAGFRKTSIGTRREHRTVGFCKDCGYTWVIDGPSFDRKRGLLSSPIVKVGLGLCIIVMIYMFALGRIYDVHKAFRNTDYEVTESNVSLVTNPSMEYVIDSLKKVEGISEIAPVLSGHDPNNLLTEDGGATSVVFFSYDKIDQSSIDGVSVIEKGTDCGGCIEVFSSEEAAKARERQLAVFGVSGSHVTIGTTIVRTSYKLSFKEQDYLESQICKALLGTTE